MALTEKSIINRTLELTGQSEQQLSRARILALIKDARVELSKRQARLLRKTYPNITATSGTASLTSLIANVDPINTALLGGADIFLAGVTRKVQMLPDLSLLNEDRPLAFPYGALVGTDLRLKANGADFSGAVTITGVSIPSLASITRAELEQEFIQIIASWSLGTELEKSKAQAARVATE